MARHNISTQAWRNNWEGIVELFASAGKKTLWRETLGLINAQKGQSLGAGKSFGGSSMGLLESVLSHSKSGSYRTSLFPVVSPSIIPGNKATARTSGLGIDRPPFFLCLGWRCSTTQATSCLNCILGLGWGTEERVNNFQLCEHLSTECIKVLWSGVLISQY